MLVICFNTDSQGCFNCIPFPRRHKAPQGSKRPNLGAHRDVHHIFFPRVRFKGTLRLTCLFQEPSQAVGVQPSSRPRTGAFGEVNQMHRKRRFFSSCAAPVFPSISEQLATTGCAIKSWPWPTLDTPAPRATSWGQR